MRQQFRNLDTWRGKLAATWICLAPPAAMVAVFAAGGVPSNQFVVDAHALSEWRQDSVFDDLAGEVPDRPGADGSLGSERRSQVEVPVIGTTDGKPQLPVGVVGDASGIPGSVLAAYQRAANDLTAAKPTCGITWPLLAGIGKVESAHASGGRVDVAGVTRGQILGPVLNGGPGMAAISDTDQGRYDGNTRWDRAVGPMQFIPGTWAAFGADGNADGVKDPHNVYDAARSAGEYLCAGGANLRDPQGLVQAVLRYNHSMDYVSTVLRWMQSYSKSAVTLPDRDGVVPPPADDNGNVEQDTDPNQVPPIDETGGTSDTDGNTGDDDALAGPVPPPSTRPAQTSRPPSSAPTQPPSPPRSTPVPTSPSSTPPRTSPPSTPSPTQPPKTTPPKTTPPPKTTTPSPNPSEHTPPTSPTTTPTPTTPTTTPTPTPSPTCTTPTPPPTATPAPTATPSPTPTTTPSGDPTCPGSPTTPTDGPSAPAPSDGPASQPAS